MSVFQVYKEVTEVVIVAEAEGLTAYRLTSYVFDALECEGGDDAGHRRDAQRHPQAMAIVQKYHVFNDSSGRSRDKCMPEVDARVLADACGCSIEELLLRAAEYWHKHDVELRTAIGGPR